ncbi:MAG TPA: hypothetical protein V6C81_23470 [Planktothrix sp.]|jgi:hypothetical protein
MQNTKRIVGIQPSIFGDPSNPQWRVHLVLKSLLMPNARGALIGAAIGAGIAMGIGVVGVIAADLMDEMCFFQHGKAVAQAPAPPLR